MNLSEKTERILGLLLPDHCETEIERLKSRIFQQSGAAAFRAFPGFIPLAAGADLKTKFHREDRDLPASPKVTLGQALNCQGHLFLQVCPWDSVADFQNQLLEPDVEMTSELLPLAQGIYLGPMAEALDLDKVEVPQLRISRFSLMVIEITYQTPRPWEHPLFWEIVFEKPLKRPVS